MKNGFTKTQLSRLLSSLFSASILVFGASVASEVAEAASATWNATPTDGYWVTTNQAPNQNNWSTGQGAFPGGNSTSSSDTATFNSASTSTTIIVSNASVASSWNIKNIIFDTANCAAFTITNTGTVTARFTGDGAVEMTGAVAQPQVIKGSQFRLHPGGGIILSNGAASTTATLTFSGSGVKANNSVDANPYDQSVVLTGGNTGSNVFSGVIADYAAPPTPGYYSSLIKTNGGTWYLAGNNTYTGPTTIAGGELILVGAGAFNSSTNVIISGGTLIFNNVMNLSAVSTNGTAAPSELIMNNSGVLMITNTSYQTPVTAAACSLASATIHVGVNGATPFTNMVVTASSGLSVGSGTALEIDQISGVLSPTTFDLIAYSGTAPSAANISVSLAANYVTAGYTVGAVNVGSGLVSVTVTPPVVPSITWVGATSGGPLDSAWNTTDLNWSNGVSYVAYADTDDVQFDDTSSNSIVTLAAPVAPTTVIVTNNVLNYTFSGTGSINSGLTKNGTAQLTLTETGGDNFSGGLLVNNGFLLIDNASGTMTGDTTIASTGTVQVGNNDAGGTLPSGTVTDNGSLVFSNSANVTVNNVISGTGTLIQGDANTVTLNGVNSTYSGNITIQQGTLKVNNTNALGSWAAGTVTITNGGTLDIGGFSTAIAQTSPNFGAKQFFIAGSGVNGNGAINNSGPNAQLAAFESITLTADATIGGTNRWDLRNGTATLTLNGHTLTKTNANQTSLVSPNITGGNIIIGQGILSFESSNNFTGTGTITVNNGAILGQYRDMVGTFTRPIILNGGSISNLSSSGSFTTNDAPITLAADSALAGSTANTYDIYLNGAIGDQGDGYGITKIGAGPVVLTAASTYDGNTVINDGSLVLAGSASIANTANIILASGTTFDVSGLTSAFTLGASQTLSNSASTAVLAGAANTGSGTVSLIYGSGTPSLVVSNGTLTLTGSTVFDINNTGASLAAGSYPIISAATTGTAGTVAGTAPSSVNVSGGGVVSGALATLEIVGGELDLVVHHPPVAGPSFTNGVTVGVPVTIQIVGGKYAPTDVDGNKLTITSVSGAANGTVTTDGTNITYTATGGTSDSFTYTVSDPYGATASQTVYVIINQTGQSYNQVSAQSIDGQAVLSYYGIPGYQYALDWTHSLTPPVTWTPLLTNAAANNGQLLFTNTPSGSMDFYRTRYVAP